MSTPPLRPKEPTYFNFIRYPQGFFHTVCTVCSMCYAPAVYENIIGESHYRYIPELWFARYACRQHQFEYLEFVYRLHHMVGQLKDECGSKKSSDN